MGRSQIFLVSPDTKKVAIEKSFREISFCSQVCASGFQKQCNVKTCLVSLNATDDLLSRVFATWTTLALFAGRRWKEEAATLFAISFSVRMNLWWECFFFPNHSYVLKSVFFRWIRLNGMLVTLKSPSYSIEIMVTCMQTTFKPRQVRFIVKYALWTTYSTDQNSFLYTSQTIFLWPKAISVQRTYK